MATYTVQDTTMQALGDAIRNHKPLKDSKTNISTIGILKTENANGIDDYTPINLLDSEKYRCSTMANIKVYDDVAKMKIKLAYITGSNTGSVIYRMRVFDKYYPMQTSFTYANQNYLYEFEIAETETIIKEFEIEGNELTLVLCPITFSVSMASRNIYFYAEVEFLDINGNHLDYYESIQVTNTMTPTKMVDEINELITIPDEAFTITGNCERRFVSDGWTWFLKKCEDKITTNNISNITYMFGYCSNLEGIPFDINMASSEAPAGYTFLGCYYLTNVPMINNLKINSGGSPQMFSDCYRIRNFPVGFADNWDFSVMKKSTYGGMSSFFSSCYSLREVPKAIIANCCNKSTGSYSTAYYNLFAGCYSLNEINGLDVSEATYTSQCFTYTFNTTNRLKNMTFSVNEDGTPKTANWKNQTIVLGVGTGWLNSTSYKPYILNYNSGITADKEVTDDATYQALKNDPDWFTMDVNYSRYNHDSAVNTINSLPDTSAYLASSGGTNTIKFVGNSGALTDGGAINTLTEEEIAVATSRGWTVSLS